MSEVKRELLLMAVRGLLEEAFTGRVPGLDFNFFVERDEGLGSVFDSLSAEEASVRLPGCSSVAAHMNHARFYLKVGNDIFEGGDDVTDWSVSWVRQTVDEAGWAEIRRELWAERERFLGRLEASSMDCIEEVGDAVMNVAHAAYHLGAVRTLKEAVKASRG